MISEMKLVLVAKLLGVTVMKGEHGTSRRSNWYVKLGKNPTKKIKG